LEIWRKRVWEIKNGALVSIKNTDKVLFGATVTLENVASEKQVIYKIVGEDEANFKENKISVTSPLSRSLIGKEVDEIITVKAPKGIDEYEILEISYQ
jgi:transcription elongation factor GreA